MDHIYGPVLRTAHLKSTANLPGISTTTAPSTPPTTSSGAKPAAHPTTTKPGAHNFGQTFSFTGTGSSATGSASANAAVPEPASFVLLVVSLFGATASCRRRRNGEGLVGTGYSG